MIYFSNSSTLVLKKVFIVCFILLWAMDISWANRLIIRGLYDGSSVLQTKNEYTVLGSDIKETDKYNMSGVMGVGFEMELITPRKKGFGFGFGYNFYQDRNVPSGSFSGTIDSEPVNGTFILEDAGFRNNSLFASFKLYFIENAYLGLQYRFPDIGFTGSGWTSGSISGLSSYYFGVGYSKQKEVCWDVGVSSTSFLIDSVKANFSIVTFSLGFILFSSEENEDISENPKTDSKSLKMINSVAVMKSDDDRVIERLKKIVKMKDEGLITEEEFVQKKKEILDSI